MRIEFLQRVKKRVAERNGYRCSFPQCDKPTIGPAQTADDSVSTGDACHIYSAAKGGPRGQGNLRSDQLADIRTLSGCALITLESSTRIEERITHRSACSVSRRP